MNRAWAKLPAAVPGENCRYLYSLTGWTECAAPSIHARVFSVEGLPFRRLSMTPQHQKNLMRWNRVEPTLHAKEETRGLARTPPSPAECDFGCFQCSFRDACGICDIKDTWHLLLCDLACVLCLQRCICSGTAMQIFSYNTFRCPTGFGRTRSWTWPVLSRGRSRCLDVVPKTPRRHDLAEPLQAGKSCSIGNSPARSCA